MLNQLPPGWRERLGPLKKEVYFKKLVQFLETEYHSGKTIYPEKPSIFRALQELDFDEVRVVLLGQDPYHGPGQALGLSFAVPNTLRVKPPSLRNIFKEMENDLGVKLPAGQSDLSGWVKQGVLLLNTVLTVEAGKPMSHRNQGWEELTQFIIHLLNERPKPLVFILWGSHAQKFKSMIDQRKHTVLESAHPSPLSAYRGFFGSRIFSRANDCLCKMGYSPIHWEQISA